MEMSKSQLQELVAQAYGQIVVLQNNNTKLTAQHEEDTNTISSLRGNLSEALDALQDSTNKSYQVVEKLKRTESHLDHLKADYEDLRKYYNEAIDELEKVALTTNNNASIIEQLEKERDEAIYALNLIQDKVQEYYEDTVDEIPLDPDYESEFDFTL